MKTLKRFLKRKTPQRHPPNKKIFYFKKFFIIFLVKIGTEGLHPNVFFKKIFLTLIFDFDF